MGKLLYLLKWSVLILIISFIPVINIIAPPLWLVFGAWMLITDPSGGKFEWSSELLNGTPFRSFLIPGIILMIANGILPLYTAVAVLMKKKSAIWLVLIQGVIVFVWLTTQLLLNPEFFVPEMHYPTYAVGLLLVTMGLLLRKLSHRK